MVAAAVLAGGASRRMGRDKATMAVGGVELASLALAAAARVADPVVLVVAWTLVGGPGTAGMSTASGPTSVASCIGSPTLSADIRATNASTNRS